MEARCVDARLETRFEPVRERLLGESDPSLLGLPLVLKSRPKRAPILEEVRTPARGESPDEGDDGCRPEARREDTRFDVGRIAGGLFTPRLFRCDPGRGAGGVLCGGGGGGGGNELWNSGGRVAATTGLMKLLDRTGGEPDGGLFRSALSNSFASTAGSRKLRLTAFEGVAFELVNDPRRMTLPCEFLRNEPVLGMATSSTDFTGVV